MCFVKTRQSKVLIAKRDIVVYKIGVYADDNLFRPYYYSEFKYPTNQIVSELVEFTNESTIFIDHGLHSYINFTLQPYRLNIVDVITSAGRLHSIQISGEMFLGKFIIPRGGTYCVNIYNEVVANRLIYTGKHIKVYLCTEYNTKKLWKEK